MIQVKSRKSTSTEVASINAPLARSLPQLRLKHRHQKSFEQETCG